MQIEEYLVTFKYVAYMCAADFAKIAAVSVLGKGKRSAFFYHFIAYRAGYAFRKAVAVAGGSFSRCYDLGMPKGGDDLLGNNCLSADLAKAAVGESVLCAIGA